MLLRCAQALLKPGFIWESIAQEDRDRALKGARLVIKALREPTEDMLGAISVPPSADPHMWRIYARHDWRVMIDQALGPDDE